MKNNKKFQPCSSLCFFFCASTKIKMSTICLSSIIIVTRKHNPWCGVKMWLRSVWLLMCCEVKIQILHTGCLYIYMTVHFLFNWNWTFQVVLTKYLKQSSPCDSDNKTIGPSDFLRKYSFSSRICYCNNITNLYPNYM